MVFFASSPAAAVAPTASAATAIVMRLHSNMRNPPAVFCLCMLGPKRAPVKSCEEPRERVPGEVKRGKMRAPFAVGQRYMLPSVALRQVIEEKEPIDGRHPAGSGRSRARGDAACLGARTGDGGGGA